MADIYESGTVKGHNMALPLSPGGALKMYPDQGLHTSNPLFLDPEELKNYEDGDGFDPDYYQNDDNYHIYDLHVNDYDARDLNNVKDNNNVINSELVQNKNVLPGPSKSNSNAKNSHQAKKDVWRKRRKDRHFRSGSSVSFKSCSLDDYINNSNEIEHNNDINVDGTRRNGNINAIIDRFNGHLTDITNVSSMSNVDSRQIPHTLQNVSIYFVFVQVSKLTYYFRYVL